MKMTNSNQKTREKILEYIATTRNLSESEIKVIMKVFEITENDTVLNDITVSSFRNELPHYNDLPIANVVNELMLSSNKNYLVDNEVQTYQVGTPEDYVKLNAHVRNEVGELVKKTQSLEETGGLSGLYHAPQPLDEFDYLVMSTINTLFKNGNKQQFITPQMIYRVINGIPENSKIPHKQTENIINSIEKQRHIFCTLDYTDQAKNWKLDTQIQSCKIDNYLINAEHLQAVVNGQLVDGYQVSSQPILCRYSELIGHITRVDAKELDIHKDGKRVQNTQLRTITKNYILKRIHVMKGKTKQKRVILYSTVLERLTPYTKKFPNDLSRAERQRILDYIIDVLNHEKELGLIKDFKEYTNDKGVRVKVEIIL